MSTVIRGPAAAEFAGVPPELELEVQAASERQVINGSAASRGEKMFTPPPKTYRE
jgi:hypothetical protein